MKNREILKKMMVEMNNQCKYYFDFVLNDEKFECCVSDITYKDYYQDYLVTGYNTTTHEQYVLDTLNNIFTVMQDWQVVESFCFRKDVELGKIYRDLVRMWGD